MTTPTPDPAANPATRNDAEPSRQQLLAQLAVLDGVSIDQLTAALTHAGADKLTVASYVQRVLPTATPGQRHTYTAYLRRLADDDMLRDRPIAEVSITELTLFIRTSTEHAQATRGNRRNSRDGRSANENAVAAVRFLFTRAQAESIRTDNPALHLKKPPRPRTPRRGLDIPQIAELVAVSGDGGDDPALDKLLVRFMLESGARRGGIIALRLRDFHHDRAVVLLREKNCPDGAEQPISPSLLRALAAFAHTRGARDPHDAVFRYRQRAGREVGAPLSKRRFNTLADRWQTSLPWAARLGVTPHTFRHTAIGLIEHTMGYAVAREFARHRDNREVTTTYLNRELTDVAQAVQVLTGEAHPLAHDRFGSESGLSAANPANPADPDSGDAQEQAS